MLSKKTKYGLLAVLALARENTTVPMLIADLAAQEKIPVKFLEQILLQLKNSGIIDSRRGKKGGYFLNQNAADITMGQVVRILEGPLAPIPCVSQTAYRKCTDCADEASCGVRLVMKDARDAISGILDQTSFEDVIRRSRDAARKSGKAAK
jgi:Rrf2 family protein